MKEVIAKMNDLLSDELTAVSQYMVHSEMCANWGYAKLADAIEKRAIDEMKHAEMHIGRILFLEGVPIVSHLKEIRIGAEVEPQLKNDHSAEDGAVKSYNDGINLASNWAITAPAKCWKRSSRTRNAILTGSKPRWIKSSAWASRTTWLSKFN